MLSRVLTCSPVPRACALVCVCLYVQLVVWLPALCRKMGVPYVVVNNKGRLGTLVHKKSAAAVALASKDIRAEDRAAFQKVRVPCCPVTCCVALCIPPHSHHLSPPLTTSHHCIHPPPDPPPHPTPCCRRFFFEMARGGGGGGSGEHSAFARPPPSSLLLRCVDAVPANRVVVCARSQLVDNAKEHNEKDGATRRWGGGVMGLKTQRRLEKRAKAIAAEAAKKAML